MKHLAIIIFCFSINLCYSQQVTGIITTTNTGGPIEGVNITITEESSGTASDQDGAYRINIRANKKNTLAFSFIGYENKLIEIPILKKGQRYELDIALKQTEINIKNVNIEDQEIRKNVFQKIDPKHSNILPSSNGSIEQIIKTLPGVSSSNELSSQYNVRGGNYNENLVYVNNIEIYRPFLIRSGQQEGLSFINSDLVGSINFAAGGFAAKYGDKMSSVLDITYKNPSKFQGSTTMSLLGFNLHLEGINKSKKLSYLFGSRYKSNKHVLNSLDTKGEYKPTYNDIQTYINYKILDNWSINFLGNYSKNKYQHIPEDRVTRFGTISTPLELRIFFEGQEVDEYETFFGAINTSYQANDELNLSFTSSAFATYESETFDILGQYWLYELDNDLGSNNFGEATFNRGVGTHLNHARNYLQATVYNIEHRGLFTKHDFEFRWGIKTQLEKIKDLLNEWTMIDSSGYSLPHPVDQIGAVSQETESLNLEKVIKTNSEIKSYRHTAYMQFKQRIKQIDLNVGIRGSYWDLNEEYLLSPRASISYSPLWNKDFVFRIATGIYHQPPFYRELRDLDGLLNKNVKAQKSIHYILGSDYNFKIWNRPFKLVSEIYYKKLENLIPYEIENVRIRYYAENSANGYSTGVDLRLNGEFIQGMESWASLSIMQTEADIEDDFSIDEFGTINPIGYYYRPADQRVNFSLFFQDYLPKMPRFKMHLKLVYGSGFPLLPPNTNKGEYDFRIPNYKRIDIGFSIMIKKENQKKQKLNPFNFSKQAWISLEFFNLLDINNTVSYLWIQDVNNVQFAVPNYLTSRQANLKLHISF